MGEATKRILECEIAPAKATGRKPNQTGQLNEAVAALERSLRLWQQQNHQQAEGQVSAFLAEAALWRGDAATARTRADRAWELAAVRRGEADFIQAARWQVTAAMRRLTLRVEPSSRRENSPLESEGQDD